jgi:RsiW-degrading membrane proteinase PrsW (M82 family)
MILYILNFIGYILIIKWLKIQSKEFKALKNKKAFFKFKRFKLVLISLFVILTPLILVNYTSLEEINHLSKQTIEKNNWFYAIVVSFFISLVWLIYIYRLDIFNKEKKRHLILILILSIVLTLFADLPYSVIHSLGFTDSVKPLASFIYSVFGIGLIEETIKLIPLLIILKFTKAIDEPYDYILYASASALGFAFVENAMYLNNRGIEIINARALYATVAHMTFSSMIAYGLFLAKFKKSKLPRFVLFISFFFFAIFSHGFYDFWLINKSVNMFSGLTTLFFLATVHIWFSIKNNTINTSNFYDKNKTIDNDKLKVYLIISLLSIFMLSYVYVALEWNSREANRFFMKSVFVYGYIIFYLIATLTKFNIVEGVLKPFKWSLKFFMPKIK